MSFFGLFVFESVESCFIWAPVRCLLRSSFMERNARPCSMCLVTPPLLVLPFFYFFFKKKKTGSDSGSVADSFIHNHLLSLPYYRSNAKIFHSSFGSVHRFALGTNFDFIHFQLLRFILSSSCPFSSSSSSSSSHFRFYRTCAKIEPSGEAGSVPTL